MTARTKILQRLALATEPLAVHEIKVNGVSDTACSARLREIRREGLVIKHKKIGVRFDYWSLTPERDIDWKDPKNARLLIQKLDKEMMLEEAEEEEFEKSVKPYWAGEK